MRSIESTCSLVHRLADIDASCAARMRRVASKYVDDADQAVSRLAKAKVATIDRLADRHAELAADGDTTSLGWRATWLGMHVTDPTELMRAELAATVAAAIAELGERPQLLDLRAEVDAAETMADLQHLVRRAGHRIGAMRSNATTAARRSA